MARFSQCGSFTFGKGWRRTIGCKVGDDGRIMPCRFWLGMDKAKATSLALQIESIWVGLNMPYWTADALEQANGLRMGATTKDVSESTPCPKTVKLTAMVKTVLTVGGMIQKFRQAKWDDASLSKPSKHSIQCRTKSLEHSPIYSMPLATVGAEQLSALVSFWLARPKTIANGKQISDYSARMIVKTARAVFDHADGIGLWVAPRRFDRLFRLPRTSTMPTVKTYSISELARLYQFAVPSMRLQLLLALNCGFCSMELATLKRNEIDLHAKVIRRARQKSGVVQSWTLWDETVKALKVGMATDGELALTTDGGKPLVWYSDKGHRVDILPNRWARLLAKANENETAIVGSFKTLRKTGATMIRAIGGIETSEIYLAHSEKTVARFYSTPNHEHLTTALASMRRTLEPMFKAIKQAKGKIAA